VSLHKLFVAMTFAVLALVFSTAALAGHNRAGFDLMVSPSKTSVASGENVEVALTSSNNSATNADYCSIQVEQTGFVAGIGPLAAGTSAGTGLSMPAGDGRKANYTFSLWCDGQIVAQAKLKVKIR